MCAEGRSKRDGGEVGDLIAGSGLHTLFSSYTKFDTQFDTEVYHISHLRALTVRAKIYQSSHHSWISRIFRSYRTGTTRRTDSRSRLPESPAPGPRPPSLLHQDAKGRAGNAIPIRSRGPNIAEFGKERTEYKR